jgi:hypothetical protein
VSRRIEVEVEGVRATYRLLDEWAPKTTGLIWEALPMEDVLLRHAKLSGDAVFLVAESPLFKALPETNELAVTSIYRGYIVANLHPDQSNMELLLPYGLAEYRWPDGRHYVTPVAELVSDGQELTARFQQTWTEGAKKITLRRLE